MLLEKLRIQNFRAIKDATVDFENYTCLIGPNGGGKSTVLNALNVLFRESSNASTDLLSLSPEDFHASDTDAPIEITATFGSLSPSAQADFKSYYRQGKLVISAYAEWDDANRRAVVIQRGVRPVMHAFRRFFDQEKTGAAVTDLRRTFAEIRAATPDLPNATTKAAMLETLQAYEEAHPDLCELTPSEDQFYGWSKGTNRLQKYVQWVFVPAVKDATTEQTEAKGGALAKLLARTVRSRVSFSAQIENIRARAHEQYCQLLDAEQQQLDSLSRTLEERLKVWSHPEAGVRIVWDKEARGSISVAEPSATILAREQAFEGKLARFGHGLQRCYLLSLLQELVSSPDADQPRLLLGCEEPELFQHPPQARHLAATLARLASEGGQVVTCTHSPLFVTGDRFQDVRLVRRRPGRQVEIAGIDQVTLDQSLAYARDRRTSPPIATSVRLQRALQPGVNELFFANHPVLVEGIEDVAFITAWMELTDVAKHFRRVGGHLVPCNGKSYMIEPLAVARHLRVPVFVVLDADADEEGEQRRARHRADNIAILRLAGYEAEDPLPAATLWKDDLVLWHTNIGAVAKADFGDSWGRAESEVRRDSGLSQEAGLDKSPLFIGLVLNQLLNDGHRSRALDQLCRQILTHAGALPRTTTSQ